jgi:hypothetical protein
LGERQELKAPKRKFVYCGSESEVRKNKDLLNAQGLIEALNNDPAPGQYFTAVLSSGGVVGRKEWLIKIHYQES